MVLLERLRKIIENSLCSFCAEIKRHKYALADQSFTHRASIHTRAEIHTVSHSELERSKFLDLISNSGPLYD